MILKFGKKQACLMIAGIVSICCMICLIDTVLAIIGAVQGGGDIPWGMVMLTLLTGYCTVLLWRSVRKMDG